MRGLAERAAWARCLPPLGVARRHPRPAPRESGGMDDAKRRRCHANARTAARPTSPPAFFARLPGSPARLAVVPIAARGRRRRGTPRNPRPVPFRLTGGDAKPRSPRHAHETRSCRRRAVRLPLRSAQPANREQASGTPPGVTARHSARQKGAGSGGQRYGTARHGHRAKRPTPGGGSARPRRRRSVHSGPRVVFARSMGDRIDVETRIRPTHLHARKPPAVRFPH